MTTLPTQSLYLMNSPFVAQQARHAAERLVQQPDLSDEQRIELAYRWSLGRIPSPNERDLMLKYVRGDNAENAGVDTYSGVFRTLFACLDFRYLD